MRNGSGKTATPMTVQRFLSSHGAWSACLLGALVPIKEPMAALRLVYYLSGLACFSTMWILHDLNIWLPRRANGLAVVTCLSAGLCFFFLACRTTVPRWLCWLLPYSRVLGVVGLVGALWASSYSLDHIAHFPTELGRPRHYWNDA